MTVDTADQDPILVLSKQGYPGAIPRGSEYPHDSHLLAHDYQIIGRLNTLNWEVDVLYQIPRFVATIHPTGDEWEFSLASSTESGPLDTELTSEGVGKIIGYPYMRVADTKATPPEVPTHWAKPDPTKPSVGLIATGQRVSEPFDPGHPVVSFSLAKQLPTLPATAIGDSILWLRKVNDGTFNYVAAQDRTVRFDFIAVNPRRGTVDGESSDGTIYDIRLDFTFNYNQWTPHKRIVVWSPEGPGNIVTAVHTDENCTEPPVIEETDVYWLGQMDELLGYWAG